MTTQNTQVQAQSEVLFQKLGNTWYVFTEVNEEVIYSAMPEGMDPRETKLELYEIIEDHMDKVVQFYQKSKRTPEVAA
ncbi:hypothetical protein [Halobacteriovorax sp. JY17]|uniref:hypothetical protein n=1 Tax=Halobacteriovorax sp. JY17 TaxID=2014617 RepID=UPI000C65C7EB|nr:hypothetical protein [Halobacteriovorax sp. JY17]PIK14748.1 MAG: hypothetical protein CES88_10440 [Halobacteriovorax sp. JY17]